MTPDIHQIMAALKQGGAVTLPRNRNAASPTPHAPEHRQGGHAWRGVMCSWPPLVRHWNQPPDRLFEDACRWPALGAGRARLTVAAVRGPCARRAWGSLRAGRRQLATGKAQQVSAARQIIEGLAVGIAQHGDAHDGPALKRRDPVGFRPAFPQTTQPRCAVVVS